MLSGASHRAGHGQADEHFVVRWFQTVFCVDARLSDVDVGAKRSAQLHGAVAVVADLAVEDRIGRSLDPVDGAGGQEGLRGGCGTAGALV